MRNTEPDSLTDSSHKLDPPRGIRVACWFGIYLGPQLVFCLLSLTNPLVMLAFPIGLLVPVILLLPKSFISDVPGDSGVFFISYGFYLGHLIWSLVARNKRTFRTLIIVLIAAVILNLAGCAMAFHSLSGIH